MSVDGTPTSSLGFSDRGQLPLPRLQTDDADVLRGEPGAPPAAGPDSGEGSALARAAACRFPDIRDKRGRERIDALVDHITETAIIRGDLEELRLEAYVHLRDAEAELGAIITGVTKSRVAVDEAKRAARPDLAGRLDAAKWTVARCTEQINRMGGSEYDAASRTYTLLGG